MENAAKALIIAAGVLIAVMILSLVMMFYNEVSDYYQSESDITVQEQLAEFNKKFENYHRDQIRGSDMISLMNRVIDYNKTQTYQEGTGYERIEIAINLKSRDIVNQFKYDTDPSSTSIIDDIIRNNNFKITNKTASNASEDQKKAADNKLVGITGIENDLINVLKNQLGVSDPTSGQLQTLSANIGNIVNIKEEYDYASLPQEEQNKLWTVIRQEILNRQKRASLIETTLNIQIEIDDETAVTKSTSEDDMELIKEIALQYYQFTQFKRAYFDCTEVKYDEETGRISEMYFEIRTDASGIVEFN